MAMGEGGGRVLLLVTVLASLWAACTGGAGSEIPWAPSQGRPSWPDVAATLASSSSSTRRAQGRGNVSEALASVSHAFRHVLTQPLSEGVAVSQCRTDFFALLISPDHNNPFNASKGAEAIDAMGKPGTYILQGNLRFYGSFDECLNIGGHLTKYCVVPLNATYLGAPIVPFRVDICVPRSCNVTDIEEYIQEVDAHLRNSSRTAPFGVVLASNFTCEDGRSVPYTGGAITMILVCAIFAALAVVGTAVDFAVKSLRELAKKPEVAAILGRRRKNSQSEDSPLLGQTPANDRNEDIFASFEKPLEFVTAFSVLKNLDMILSTKQPPSAITSLNGIRVMSMFWVILCHTHYWALITGVLKDPAYVLVHYTHRFSFQPITNGFYSVDSFFLLSGALVAYLTLREMERRRGRFPFLTYYLHRYLRLTMVYAFLLFFWWTLTVHLGDGPTWRESAGEGSGLQKNCEKYWWTNFLYINNLYPWGLGDECMGWTWYLSNDMQFYVFAPLILIPLYFFFPIGLGISAFVILGTFIANGAIAGVHGFQANVFQIVNPDESNDIYIKPYTRAGPYVVGLVLGFILFKKVRINIHWFVDWLLYRVVLLVAGGCLFSTVYGLYSSWDRGGLSLAENVSYFMFSRFVWGVGLALLVFACHNGYGRAINAFLSMKFWIPLSRLTYTAYLIHPMLLTVIFGTLREPFTYTDYMLVVFAVAMVVLSFGAAGVVAVFVEFPLSNLEMAVFKAVGLKPRESARNIGAQKEGVHLETRNAKPELSKPINYS
jgi:peptidoglycan/LPS O-acetylase OafA/YrhL